MNVTMAPLQIMDLKTHLRTTISALRRAGCVQIDQLADTTAVSARPLTLDRDVLRQQEKLGVLITRIDRRLNTLGNTAEVSHEAIRGDCLEEAEQGVDELLPKVQEYTSHSEALRSELSSLPRYQNTLRKLLPLIPGSAQQPENVTVGVLVSRGHVGVLDGLGWRLLDLTGGRAEIVAGDVDAGTRALPIVFPAEFTMEIEAILGQDDVSRLRLPTRLGDGPPNIVRGPVFAACSPAVVFWRLQAKTYNTVHAKRNLLPRAFARTVPCPTSLRQTSAGGLFRWARRHAGPANRHKSHDRLPARGRQ